MLIPRTSEEYLCSLINMFNNLICYNISDESVFIDEFIIGKKGCTIKTYLIPITGEKFIAFHLAGDVIDGKILTKIKAVWFSS